MSVCVKCLRPAELVYGGGAVMACMCNDVDTRASVIRYLRAMAEGLYRDARDGKYPDHERSRLRDHGSLLHAASLDIDKKLDLDPERLLELGIES